MMGLTQRQQECLDFIKATIAARDYPPTYDEIAKSLDLHSRSGVQRIVMGLESRGLIRRIPGKARAIEVVDPSSMRAVMLSGEVFRLVQAYAASERISVDVAASELLRGSLGASA